MANNHFNRVGGLKPRRNVFDLSYRQNFTCDIGELIPCMCDEVVPGDTFKISQELVVRFQPLSAPVMHEFSATIHTFFIPYRLLGRDESSIWPSDGTTPLDQVPLFDFEKFIAQGQLAGDVPLPVTLPVMRLSSGSDGARDLYSLWDYFGFPVTTQDVPANAQNVAWPLQFPWLAYNKVYNEYYRDQDLQDLADPVNPFVLLRDWRKDYFTSARPFRQKGTAPALPVEITGGLSYSEIAADVIARRTGVKVSVPTNLPGAQATAGNLLEGFLFASIDDTQSNGSIPFYGMDAAPDIDYNPANNTPFPNQVPNEPYLTPVRANQMIGIAFNNTGRPDLPSTSVRNPPTLFSQPGPTVAGMPLYTDNNDILRSIVPQINPAFDTHTFDVSDLRLTFQTQKWLERNARAGTRYTEFLRSHFGVSPSDSRLDRPEYIGGVKTPIIISEVLQTSETTPSNPLAEFAGHGLAADGQFVGSYHVQEFGLILSLFSILPKPCYQDGINRQWLRKLPTDFYFPEFSHLSEQMINQCEIFAGFGLADPRVPGTTYNDFEPFGFTGQYDEMRVKNDVTCAEMRNLPGNLGYWNAARKFSVAPRLNSSFVTCQPEESSRIFATEDTGSNNIIVNVYNKIRATRPMPLIADPGLVDHF